MNMQLIALSVAINLNNDLLNKLKKITKEA